jgi:hypothetical protein
MAQANIITGGEETFFFLSHYFKLISLETPK